MRDRFSRDDAISVFAARRLLISIAIMLAALASTPAAQAGGGDYVFDGGSPKARAQVTAALEASSFDWSVVPVQVTIHIGRGYGPDATPGEIWLDPRLLAAGKFSWGIVQHEYAHQVAFFAFGGDERRILTRALGARDWCYEVRGLSHDEHACERLASTLAWVHWPAKENTERTEAAMKPNEFRSLIRRLLASSAG